MGCIICSNVQLLLLAICMVVLTRVSGQLVEVNDGNPANIIGGVDVTIEEAPWQAVIFTTWGQLVCGASFISPNMVITARHCVDYLYGNRGYVGFGLTSIRNPPPSKVVAIRSIVRYPNFHKFFLGKDVSLLVLEKNVVLSDTLKIIQVASPVEVNQSIVASPGSVVGISGYGAVEATSNEFDYKLKAAEVKIITSEFARNLSLREDYFGAGNFPGNGGIGACTGDSGGPLVQAFQANRNSTEYKLLGAASFVIRECASPEFPVVYTALWQYKAWIDRALEITNQSFQAVHTIRRTAKISKMSKRTRFSLYVPRGVSAMRVYMKGPGARSTRLYLTEFPPFLPSVDHCVQNGPSGKCFVYLPLEGEYALRMISSSKRKASITALVEFQYENMTTTNSSLVTVERHSIESIKPRTIRYLPRLSVMPGDVINVNVVTEQPDQALNLHVFKGNQRMPYPDPGRICKKKLDRMSVLCIIPASAGGTLVSVAIENINTKGNGSGQIDVEYLIQRKSKLMLGETQRRVIEEVDFVGQKTYIQSGLIPGTQLGVEITELVQRNNLPKMPKANLTLLVSFRDSVNVDDLECTTFRTLPGMEGVTAYCSAIVPQFSTTARIVVQAPANYSSQFRLGMTFNEP